MPLFAAVVYSLCRTRVYHAFVCVFDFESDGRRWVMGAMGRRLIPLTVLPPLSMKLALFFFVAATP